MRGTGIERSAVAFIGAIALAVAACGTPGPTIDPAAPTGRVEAGAVEGRFQVTFAIDRGVVRSSEPVKGEARLLLLAPGGANLSGPSSVFVFDFMEVGGEGRHVAPVWDAVCAPHRVTANTPIASPILKSGAVTGPQAGFIADFLKGTDVRLPRGTWDITAIAMFVDGEGCQGVNHTIQASVRVHVSE